MKKQIVWIMTDTTRYDMVGCYGNPDMKTPNIDALATEGVRFERAYSAQPVCGPARSLLFTGLYPHENGSWGNCMPLGADVKTLGQRLSAGGIPCGYIGKWHLDGGDYFGYGVCPDGWDPKYWYDMKCYLDELPDDQTRRLSRKESACYDNGGVTAEFTYGHRVTNRALSYIDEHAEDDFFLTVSYDEPHGPSLCPEPYASMYLNYALPDTPANHDTLEGKPMYQKLWARSTNPADKPGCQPLLFGCNSYIDEEIGRVVAKIHEKLPDALIIFTSDHGDALCAHGLNAKGASVYDEIARVPLIFAGAPVQKGVVCSHTVSHADLPATVLDYMGIPVPACFSGESLMPVVQNGETADDGRAFVEFTRYERDHDGFGGMQPMRAIVTDHYKLAIHLTDKDELYDIDRDPHNMTNLIDDSAYAAIRNELHDRILDWMNETRDPFRGYQWQCRPWRTDVQPGWEVHGYTRQAENEAGEPRQLDYDTGLAMTEATRFKKKSR